MKKYLIVNLLALAVVGVLALFVNFNDGQEALSQGVFSVSSLSGYSIKKTLLLYGTYLASGIVFLLAYNRLKKPTSKPDLFAKSKLNLKLTISKKEILVLALVIAIVVVMNLLTAGGLFNLKALIDEEFFHLAPFIEISQGLNFDLVYAYSFGNLIALSWFQKLGLPIVFYKIAINAAALVLAYLMLSIVIQKPKQRWLYYGFFIVLNLYTILVPALHRNIFRFLLPLAFMFALWLIRTQVQTKLSRYLLMSVAWSALLFFGTVDNIVLGSFIYLGFVAVDIYENKQPIDILWYLAAPGLGLLLLLLLRLYSTDYLASAFQSLATYSSHFNAKPFLNPFQPSALSATAITQHLTLTFLFYAPIVIAFNILLFLLDNLKKQYLKLNNRYVLLGLLAVANIIYFRQNFGEVGLGRISLTTVFLVFLTALLYQLGQKDDRARYIAAVSLIFLASLSFYTVYSSRAGLAHLAENRALARAAEPCPTGEFHDRLAFTSYKYCDPMFLEELAAIRAEIDDSSFFVFDDRSAFYYLFDRRPLAIAPSLHMALDKQKVLAKRVGSVDYIIYPQQLHFFSVPQSELDNPKLLAELRNLIRAEFRLVFTGKNFQLLKKK